MQETVMMKARLLAGKGFRPARANLSRPALSYDVVIFEGRSLEQQMKQTESAGGIVVNATTGLILLVSQYGTSWSLPKGHIEEGEDWLAAAHREIHEESGVTQLDYVKDLGSYQRYRLSPTGGEDRTELKVIHMFLFTTTEDTLCPLDPANPEARWVDRAAVAQLLTHPEDKEFFLKAIQETTK